MRDGVWVVVPRHALRLIALEVLESLLCQRGRSHLPGPGGWTLRIQLPVQLSWVDFVGGSGEFLDKVVPVRQSRGDVARTLRTGLSEGREAQRSELGA